MGKRSNFERIERDFYPTPYEAVAPLLLHLGTISTYYEPCAGDGQLIRHLNNSGYLCTYASDIEPRESNIERHSYEEYKSCDSQFITNPPWDRKILHPLIKHLSNLAPTWLLFDADWAYTKQAKPYLKYCDKIVSVGRVKWIPDSKMTGKDNCAWYLFLPNVCQTKFYNL